MAEVEVNQETIKGQPLTTRKKDDAQVQVHEVKVKPDEVITDPNSKLAVQVPEGSGADSTGEVSRLGQRLQDPAPEDAGYEDDSSGDEREEEQPAPSPSPSS